MCKHLSCHKFNCWTQDASVVTDYRLLCTSGFHVTLVFAEYENGPILLVGPPLKIPFSVSAVETLSNECESCLLA